MDSRGAGGKEDETTEHRGFLGQWDFLYGTILVDTCHDTFVKNHWIYTKRKPCINYGLWVIMMCHCRFTDFNKGISLWQEVDSGEAMYMWGRWPMGTLCLLRVQFCCVLETAQILNSIKNIKIGN